MKDLVSVNGDCVPIYRGIDDEIAALTASRSTPFFFVEEALEVAEQVLVLQDEVEPAIHRIQHADVPECV